MTLEEAILHCEEVAICRKGDCSDEHRQLAEWLKELKAYRETYPYGVDRFNGSDTPQTKERSE